MAFAPCNIESTYVESNLRIFDMTWAAKIDSTVESILAAPDPHGPPKFDAQWNCARQFEGAADAYSAGF